MEDGLYFVVTEGLRERLLASGPVLIASDPIGTFFDPARVYEKFQSGVDFKTLQPTIRAGAYKPDLIPDIGLPT